MAIYSYLLVWGGVLLGMQIGYFEPDTPHQWLFGGTLALNLLVFFLIQGGFSERWRDPSLTTPQMIIGILLITLLLHYSRDMRGAMLAIYFMVMTFGVFALARRRMIVMALFVLACFITLEVVEYLDAPQYKIVSLSLGHLSILTMGLAWFIYVGGHIHNLQQRNRDQRTSLQAQQRHLEQINQQLQDAMARLEEVAIRDSLTGLFNRRHFMERIEEEMARAERQGNPLHLALIDLDHFKKINDTWGHQAGDQVLVRFAETARNTLRRSDLIARYGGEEFVILLTAGDTHDIRQVLERLRSTLSGLHFGGQAGFQVTLSAGLATWRQGDTVDSLFQRADVALYRAKNTGRNRLVEAEA
ncbi:GGDEF domain-containing protein [Alcanivorax sp. JB21]|nr:GGDEF domain-containing protein [Alcanivorax limicola]